MALNNWIDKVNGIDVVDAEDINNIAHSVIALEEQDNAVPYVFYYYDKTTEGTNDEIDANNAERFEKLIEDITAEKYVTLYIDYYGDIYPACFTSLGNISILADFPNGDGYLKIEKKPNLITYSYYDSYSFSFSETKEIPATQKATAEWVKTLINDTIAEGEW